MQNNSQTEQSSHDPLGRSPSEIGLEVALSILFARERDVGRRQPGPGRRHGAECPCLPAWHVLRLRRRGAC